MAAKNMSRRGFVGTLAALAAFVVAAWPRFIARPTYTTARFWKPLRPGG